MKKTDLEQAYQTQRRNALIRRIPWSMSYREWLNIWESSGQLGSRGRGPDSAVMARRDHRLGFEPSNVYITTGSQAAQDYWSGTCRSQAVEHNRAIAQLRSRGVRTPQGEFPSIQAAARAEGIPVGRVHWRLRHWPDRYQFT